MKKWSIKFRIVIPLLAILVVGVAARTVLVAVNSYATATELSTRLAREAVERHAGRLSGIGLGCFDVAVALGASAQELSESDADRQAVVDIMEDVLDGSYIIMGIWTCWEPDAYDGADAQSANSAPYEDETGRFLPYVYRTSIGGEIKYAPMTDYNDPEKSDFYVGAKKAGGIYVTDPFEYTIEGVPKMFCTVSIPIMRDGEAVGVAGVDLTLESLSEKTNENRTFENATIFALNSSGQFIFHPSVELVRRSYSDTWMTDIAEQIDIMLGGTASLQAFGYNADTHERMLFTGRKLNFANGDRPWIIGSVTPLADITRSSVSLTTINAVSGAALIVIVVLTVLVIIRHTLKELPIITGIADKLGVGDIDVELERVPSGDTGNEIGRLKQSFDRLIRSTKKQVDEVQHIARGNYTFSITPQSDKDLLNIALRDMAGSLNDMFNQASEERARAEAASETKSNFLANMSHEMRTPLNAVVGLSELSLGSGELRGEAKENIEKVYSAGITLLGLVNDILDLSKIEAGKLELIPVEYDMASLINDTITLNISRIGSKPIQFNLDVDATLPSRLFGDELRIKQVFNNLLSNAFKYTKEGDVDFSLSSERDGDDVWLTCSVKDSGIGIKPEDIKKLFSDYNQVDTKSNRKIEGTGLGLSITKKMVELMEGTIAVESEYGRGSVFTVRFLQKFVTDVPIGERVAEKLKAFHYVDSKRNRNETLVRISLPYARVLVVDDVMTNLDVARGILKPYNMQIDCVTSGQAAIDLVRRAEVKYNAIFMDHMMPGMDGIEATRIIREEIGTEYARSVPILALTANAIIGNEEMFLKNGFQAFLSKPIDIMAMDAAIRQWVRDKSQESALGAETEDGVQEAHTPAASALDRRVTAGLDIEKGLGRFGGDEETYTEVLKSYAKNTPELLDKAREVTAAGLADYAVIVHGIKASSRSIGAEQVGEMAEALEHAAKEGDADFVNANNGGFIQAAETLLAEISDRVRSFDDAHPKEKKSAPDTAVLAALREACAQFDIDGVDKAMEELDGFEYETGAELVEWLREQVGVAGFKRIAERLSEIV
ncbi:MAG: response regulator [Oscillospiraceae bacterium]|nr:response regulator [Oscillospiraceae bacterium]